MTVIHLADLTAIEVIGGLSAADIIGVDLGGIECSGDGCPICAADREAMAPVSTSAQPGSGKTEP